MDFLKQILKQNKAEDALLKVKPVLDTVTAELKRKKISADALIGGSVAKGTYLKHFDCDIFVRFDMEYKDKNLSDLLEKALACFPKKERVHGSRDYFRLVHSGTEYEIIPVLRIGRIEDALNITDASPLHVEWVQKHIGHLADDVRLAKLFCKGRAVYGAESYINGFSGYILEVLTIHYGGFVELLKGAVDWAPGRIIDHTGYYKNHHEVMKSLNRAKLESPLILIDPVQKDRNAAAALSHEKFARFIAGAREYLAKPSKKYFIVPKFSLTAVRRLAKKEDAELIIIEVTPEEGKRDVVGSKILRCFNHIRRQLELNEFKLLGSDWIWDGKALLWYIVYPKEQPKTRLHEGPLVYSNKKDVMRFIEKHKEYHVENYRMYANVDRKYTLPKKLVLAEMRSYFKDKIKRCRLLKL